MVVEEGGGISGSRDSMCKGPGDREACHTSGDLEEIQYGYNVEGRGLLQR